jgi:hypothetical protein
MSASLPRAVAAEQVVLRTPALGVAIADVRVAADHVIVSIACAGDDADADLVQVAILEDGRRWGMPAGDELRELGAIGSDDAGRVAAALGHPLTWSGGGSGTKGASLERHHVAPIPATGDLTLLLTVRRRDGEIEVVLDGDELRAAAAHQIAPWG